MLVPWLWVVSPAEATSLEYQVKASYLYNFARFVTWPTDPAADTGTFNLCAIAPDRFVDVLNELAGEKVDGRTVVVRRLGNASEARVIGCHLLFLAEDKIPSSGPVVSERGLLTVGDSPGFTQRGGIINLVEVQGRIRFEINQEAATRTGLTLSSRLLRLALERP